MNVWEAALLGLVEGITEYLPISSTGHLIITAAFLNLGEDPQSQRAVNAFSIVIQGGAILAVLLLFRPRVAQMIRGLLGRDAVGLRLFRNIVLAFLPAAISGVLLDDWIEARLFRLWPVIGALALGGVLMLVIGHWQRRFFKKKAEGEPADVHEVVDIEHLTWRRALIIGLMQCFALWPGASRSMMTIVGGMIVGLKPRQAAEFSFLLGLPTLGGACCYKLMKNLGADAPNLFAVLGWPAVIVGFLVAAVSAALAVQWLVGFLNRHSLALFGWYRLVLCLVLVWLVWSGRVSIAPPLAAPEATDVTAAPSVPPAPGP